MADQLSHEEHEEEGEDEELWLDEEAKFDS